MSDNWMSIVEYARAYSVSDMTVRRRIKTGKLQAILRNGKYYIPSSVNSHQDSCERFSSGSQERPFNHQGNENFFSEPESRHSSIPVKNSSMNLSHEDRRTVFHQSKKPQVTEKWKNQSPRESMGFERKDSLYHQSLSAVPEGHRNELMSQNLVSLKAKDLLSFCNRVLDKSSDESKKQVDVLKNQVSQLKDQLLQARTQVESQDKKLQAYEKQIEELNMLVSFLENQS